VPRALRDPAGAGRRVPLTGARFVVGRSPRADLVLRDQRVAPRHAAIRYVHGEHVLRAEAPVRLNGRPVTFLPLRDGDRIALGEDGGVPELVFEDRLGGAFVPPGGSLAEAWIAHPAFHDPANGPDRYGPGETLGPRPPARVRRVCRPEGDLVVKVQGPVASAAGADAWLRAFARLAGASHRALGALVDGGLAPRGEGAVRWVARLWVEGRSAGEAVEEGTPPDLSRVVQDLRGLAGALRHLHARGLVHRDVSPGNVILRPEGGAVLIDFDHAFLVEAGPPEGVGVVGTPGYVAPEVVLGGPRAASPATDVYGLAAVGYALLTGRAPAEGEDVLETLAGAQVPPPRPADLGLALPPALESALLEGLWPDPARRPTAHAFARALAFAEAALGVGDDA
jgi:hypothetical protein